MTHTTTMADAPGSPSHGTPLGEVCPRCDLELVLLANKNTGKADSPACLGYADTCVWAGIVLSWDQPCSFFCETLPVGTTTLSRKLEGQLIVWILHASVCLLSIITVLPVGFDRFPCLTVRTSMQLLAPVFCLVVFMRRFVCALKLRPQWQPIRTWAFKRAVRMGRQHAPLCSTGVCHTSPPFSFHRR